MKIFLGSDHAGFELKEKLAKFLEISGHEVVDKGAFQYEKEDDYPDFIKEVARGVAADQSAMGIILGKTGEGEAVAANRFPGVRAGTWYGGEIEIVRLMREHNNANILSLAAGFIGEEEAKEAILIFLNTPFSNEERHIRRIKKIDNG